MSLYQEVAVAEGSYHEKFNSDVQTMSSLEIAELTGKRHSDVLRDIRNTEKSLSAELRLGFKSTTYTDSTGRTNPCYNLDKDSTICLISGYDVNARMKIIKRWQKLESQPQRIPMTKAELALEYQKMELRKSELQVKKLELSFKLPENPFLSNGQIQVITDAIADSFCEGKAENNRDKWIGCAQLAEEMGYKITASNRTKLGKFLMNYELDRKQEHRLCNGQCRVINIYRECDELREAITFFFELN